MTLILSVLLQVAREAITLKETPMLKYQTRIRDLVHGTVYLTGLETRIIDHPLFQRLKHIRQNDVAYDVYPSINTSRFEHVLGACHVAGRMAENITLSPKWRIYAGEIKKLVDIKGKDEFVELVRLYALLHDIGHFPLSHLFEKAVEDSRIYGRGDEMVLMWFGESNYTKLHEAFGALMFKRIVKDVRIPEGISDALSRVMTTKNLKENDVLFLVKCLVDSPIDADRIDFVARDGILAGGEYGNHDIERLCKSIFMDRDRRGWYLAYSEKAITSMEALLLDRYRAYAWIFFHQRVATMKMLTQFLIGILLKRKVITPLTFTKASSEELSLFDDMWLWNLIRELDPKNDNLISLIKHAVILREKKDFVKLWKNRPQFDEAFNRVEKAQGVRSKNKYEYVLHVENEMEVKILTLETKIVAIKEKSDIAMYSESEKRATGKTLLDESELMRRLNAIAKKEPEFYRILVAEDIGAKSDKKREKYFRIIEEWYANF